MPIAFVDRQLNDIGRKVDPILAEAASCCCQWMVKSRSSSRHFFMSKSIMTNPLKNILNEFDQLEQSKGLLNNVY